MDVCRTEITPSVNIAKTASDAAIIMGTIAGKDFVAHPNRKKLLSAQIYQPSESPLAAPKIRLITISADHSACGKAGISTAKNIAQIA